MKLSVIVMAVILILSGFGYVRNIVRLANCDFKSPYKAEVIHTVGIIIPVVGAVTGYMDLGE